jgi:hypothetical protein
MAISHRVQGSAPAAPPPDLQKLQTLFDGLHLSPVDARRLGENMGQAAQARLDQPVGQGGIHDYGERSNARYTLNLLKSELLPNPADSRTAVRLKDMKVVQIDEELKKQDPGWQR